MTQNSEKPVTIEYFLKPGYIYLPDRPTTISTVLGSSMALTVYDRKQKIGGMNHFLYPYAASGTSSTAQYANVASMTLIRMMIQRGAKPGNLEAQLFGGAWNQKYSKEDIGSASLKVVRQILARKKIKIVSEDVGGELGRKIVFNTATCEILTLKVDRLRISDWYPYPEDR